MMEETSYLSHIRFTQHGKTLLVGHSHGVDLHYTSQPLKKLGVPYTVSHEENQEPVMAEGLYDTKIAILATNASPLSYISLMDMREDRIIVQKHFQKPILNVKMNKKFFAVCLENAIRIFTLNDAEDWYNLEILPSNKDGVIDMAERDERCLIAYPGSEDKGDVALFDPVSKQAAGKIAAHNGLLAAMKFNFDGTLLATASDKGTVIRVFSVAEKTRIYEFRRGMMRESKFLCVSSNKETVHVFKLDEANKTVEQPRPVEQGRTAYGWNSYFYDTMASVVPSAVTDYMSTDRAFATMKIPGTPKQVSVAMVEFEQDSPAVLVATLDGFLYYYTLAPEGGECILVKQHQIGHRGVDKTVRNQERKEGTPPISKRMEKEKFDYYAESDGSKHLPENKGNASKHLKNPEKLDREVYSNNSLSIPSILRLESNFL